MEHSSSQQLVASIIAIVVIIIEFISFVAGGVSAFPASPRVVNCSSFNATSNNNTIAVSSNSWFVLNCFVNDAPSGGTTSDPIMLPSMVIVNFVVENTTATELENVLIDARSTNVFPSVEFGVGINFYTLSNITVKLFNLSTKSPTTGREARVLRGPTAKSFIDFKSNTVFQYLSIIIDQCSIVAYFSAPLINLYATGSFNFDFNSVSLTILHSQLSLTCTKSQPGMFFMISSYATIGGGQNQGITRGVTYRIEDSNITALLETGSTYHHGLFSICPLHCHPRCTNVHEFHLVCLSFDTPRPCLGYNTNDTSDPTAYGGVFHLRTYNATGINVSLTDVVVDTAVPSWDLFLRVSMRIGVVFLLSNSYRMVDCMTGLVSHIQRTNVTNVGRQGAAIINVVSYLLLQESVVTFDRVDFFSQVHGALRALDGGRVSALIVLETSTHRNLALVAKNTVAHMHVTSGEATVDAASTSIVVLISAAIFLISSAGNGLSVSVLGCTANIYQLNGYASFLKGGPIVFLTLVASLVNVALPSGAGAINADNHNATIVVENSILSCTKNFTVPTAPLLLTAVISSINTIIVVTTTLIDSSMQVTNSSVVVVSFSAALSSQLISLLGVFATATNITSVVCAADAKSLMSKVIPVGLAGTGNTSLAAYLDVPPTVQVNVRIIVNGCGLFLVPSASVKNQTFVDRAVSAVVLPPSAMSRCVIVIMMSQLSTVLSNMGGVGGAMGGLAEVQPVAISGFGDVNLTQSNATIAGNINNNRDLLFYDGNSAPCAPLTGALESRWGTMRVDGGLYTLRNGLLLTAQRPLRVNALVSVDSINNVPSHVVLVEGVNVEISGVVFSGFVSLASSSMILTTSSSKSEGEVLPQFIVGCNVWDGATMSTSRIGSVVPSSQISSPLFGSGGGAIRDSESFKKCKRLALFSFTETAHPPLHPIPGKPDTNLQRRQAIASIALFGAIAASQGAAGSSRGGPPAVFGAFAVLQMRRRCTLQTLLQQEQSGESSSSSSSSTGGNSPQSCAPMDNILQLTFIASSIPDSLQCAVGTVIGNIVIAVVMALLSHAGRRYGVRYLKNLIVAPRKNANDDPKLSKNTSLHSAHFVHLRNMLVFFCTTFPGSMALPFSIVGVPTLAAAVTLVGSGDSTPGLVVVGIVVLILCVGFPLGVVWNVLLRVRPFPLSSRVLRAPPLKAAPSVMSWLTHPTTEWQSTKGLFIGSSAGTSQRGASPSEHLKNFWPYFEGLRGRRQWFFCIDFSCSTLTGIFIGASYAAPDSAACEALIWAGCCVAIAAVLEMVLCCVLQPFSTPIENISCGLVTLLAFASEVISLAVDDNNEEGANAASTLALLGTIAQFLPVIITTVYGWEWKLQQAAEASHLPWLVSRSADVDVVSRVDIKNDGHHRFMNNTHRSSSSSGRRGRQISLLSSSAATNDALASLVEAICAHRCCAKNEGQEDVF
ncbi:transmembrane protein, putative [Bodo saltans]|uniref:Transmembrane protein, putative n=1 Tax=Bodo saltans TaxID=75058 RepID=A0A0S4JLS0_BODSA|nr:transmembrane protein, putative [Bodo saltans]|eukprot:CUG90865.1 transmembrane protein, putative [Bodo saltans]